MRWGAFLKGMVVGGSLILIYKFVMRDSLIGVINHNLGPEEAGVLRGILLGDKGAFSKDFYRKLIDSGLVHLMVASGTNVMLLSKLLIEKSSYLLGRRWAIVWGLVLLWGYAGMVGFEAPIVRAAFLISFYYWAQLLGRKFDINRALIVTIILMLLVRLEFIKEVGFWLSLVSFWAITSRDRSFLGRRFGGVLGETLWVSLWVSPLLSMVFGRVNLIGVVSNVLVLFLVEIVSVLGVLGIVLSLISLERVVFWLLFPALRYVVMVVEWGAGVRMGSIELRINWVLMIGIYLLMIYGVKRIDGKKRT